jgi:hypothetical protein
VIGLISSDKDNRPDALNELTPKAFGLGMDSHCQHSPQKEQEHERQSRRGRRRCRRNGSKKLDQAGEAQDQLVQFIQDNLMSAALVFVGIGYVLGKII